MRKFIYGILLAAFAMFSACEAIQPQDELVQEDVVESASMDTVIFSASLDQDTKTHLVWSDEAQTFKTVWVEGDYIWVYEVNTDMWRPFTLVEGAGTTSAKFKGSIGEQERYVAAYGDVYGGSSDWVGLELSYNQWLDFNESTSETSFSSGICPMVARSSSTTLNFKNVCSVLCVSLTGNGEEVSAVRFQSRNSNCAGQFDVYFDGNDEPYIGWTGYYSNTITNYCYGTLSSTPLDIYFVIPYGTYEDGFDICVETNVGTMKRWTFEDVEFERSQVRRVNLEWSDDHIMRWGLVGSFNDWGGGPGTGEYTDVLMTQEGNYWVLRGQYLEAYSEFKVRYGWSWDQNYGGYGSWTDVNNPVSLSWFGDNMYVSESGYYDIYLDLNKKLIYVLTEGTSLEDVLPDEIDLEHFIYLMPGYGIVTVYVGDSSISYDPSIYAFSGEGSYLKFDVYSEDGSTLYPGTYYPCENAGTVTEGTFGIGWDPGDIFGIYFENWGTCYMTRSSDGNERGIKVTDGTITVEVLDDIYTIVVNSSTVRARYVGPLS